MTPSTDVCWVRTIFPICFSFSSWSVIGLRSAVPERVDGVSFVTCRS